MKKMSVVLLIVSIFLFCSNGLFAEAIGLKIGWNKMLDDYADAEYKDHISGGLFFDVGTEVIGASFRPGIDYVNFKSKNDNVHDATVYALHLDFYWFFMHQASFDPFIGFGQVQLDPGGLAGWVVSPDNVDEAPLGRRARIGDHDPVEGVLLGPHPS